MVFSCWSTPNILHSKGTVQFLLSWHLKLNFHDFRIKSHLILNTDFQHLNPHVNTISLFFFSRNRPRTRTFVHDYFSDKIPPLAKTISSSWGTALPCPIPAINLGLELSGLVLWPVVVQYIFHTVLKGSAWEYLNKAGQATLIKQASTCVPPQCSAIIHTHTFLPTDEQFSFMISNLFKQVILNEDRYTSSAGNWTCSPFTFYFSLYYNIQFLC